MFCVEVLKLFNLITLTQPDRKHVALYIELMLWSYMEIEHVIDLHKVNLIGIIRFGVLHNTNTYVNTFWISFLFKNHI